MFCMKALDRVHVNSFRSGPLTAGKAIWLRLGRPRTHAFIYDSVGTASIDRGVGSQASRRQEALCRRKY
jgi:hypothetical protein